MSHPANKLERFKIGVKKSKGRVYEYSQSIPRNPNDLCRFRNTTKICSCWMCCNPRHSKGFNKKMQLTRQEKKADQSMGEQVHL